MLKPQGETVAMRQKAFLLSPETCRAATQHSANFLQDIESAARSIEERQDRFIEYARRDNKRMSERALTDPEHDRRLDRPFCVRCHYEPRLGGAACTTRPCALCGVDQGYGSTNTDILCQACAKQHALCRHCGGDIGADTERTEFPASPGVEPYAPSDCIERCGSDEPCDSSRCPLPEPLASDDQGGGHGSQG